MNNPFISTADSIGVSLALVVYVLFLLGLLILKLFREGGIEGFAREYNRKKMDAHDVTDNYQRDVWIMLAIIVGLCMSDLFLTASVVLVMLLSMLKMESYIRHIHKRMLDEQSSG